MASGSREQWPEHLRHARTLRSSGAVAQGLVTPQDQLSGASGKRKRRGDSPGPWRKRRGADSDGNPDVQPPKRSANNKVPFPSPALCLVPTEPIVPYRNPGLGGL